VFVARDTLALVLQVIGGGMAATAGDKDSSSTGVNIIIAGLMSQIITLTLFLTLWGRIPSPSAACEDLKQLAMHPATIVHPASLDKEHHLFPVEPSCCNCAHLCALHIPCR